MNHLALEVPGPVEPDQPIPNPPGSPETPDTPAPEVPEIDPKGPETPDPPPKPGAADPPAAGVSVYRAAVFSSLALRSSVSSSES
jgi:hypothetical protein